MRRINNSISPREREVLGLIAELHTSLRISQKLGISIRTVEEYIYRIGLKTGIHKREFLIKYAQEHGYGKQVTA
jgi:DNA-binding CsgD family transcriptional regulator